MQLGFFLVGLIGVAMALGGCASDKAVKAPATVAGSGAKPAATAQSKAQEVVNKLDDLKAFLLPIAQGAAKLEPVAEAGAEAAEGLTGNAGLIPLTQAAGAGARAVNAAAGLSPAGGVAAPGATPPAANVSAPAGSSVSQ